MDSRTRSFQVPESMTIGDFKRRIAETVSIPAINQRLIFQGRVLGDNILLCSDHHEKTFHLVQRHQPTPTTSNSNSSTTSTSRTNTTQASSNPPNPQPTNLTTPFEVINQMLSRGVFSAGPATVFRSHVQSGAGPDGAMNIEINLDDAGAFPSTPNPHANFSSARRAADTRMSFERMWGVLQRFEIVVNTIENLPQRGAAQGSNSSTSTANSTPATTAESQATANGTTSTAPPSAIPRRNFNARQSRGPLVTELQEFNNSFNQIYQRFLPFQRRYQDFLQRDPAFTSTVSREYQQAALFFNHIPQAFRHIADIYDFLASVSIPLERVPPRPVAVRSRRSTHRSAPMTTTFRAEPPSSADRKSVV